MAIKLPKAIIFNFFCLASLLVTIVLFQGVGKPYHRGFFCDDESISKPFKDSTVPSSIAGVVGILIPAFAIALIEWPRFREVREDESKPFYKTRWSLQSNIGPWSYNLYKKDLSSIFLCKDLMLRFRWLCAVYTCFLVGAAATVVLTDVGKYTIGRLRPHFFAVCKPDFSKLNCTIGFKKNFITDYECTGDKDLIREARLSFPSGHSSFAAYCMMFLVLYVELQMVQFSFLRLLKPFVEFALMLLGLLCGLSRVSDYKHHWSDVFAGLALGTFIAFFFVLRVLELHCVRKPSKNGKTECQAQDINIQESDDIERDRTSDIERGETS